MTPIVVALAVLYRRMPTLFKSIYVCDRPDFDKKQQQQQQLY